MYAIIQRHKRLAAIIIAVASLSFLFWMFSVADIQQMFGLKRCAAEVNGECITLREFRYELLRYSDLLEKEDLRGVVKRQVLYSLISREVLYQKAIELGIRASDTEVAEAIKRDPNFSRDGKFDIGMYKEALERVGLTPSEYESYLKKQLTVRRLINLISKLVYLTDREREFQERILSTRFEGKVYLISPKSVSLDYKPSAEDLERYYRENKEKFLTPEKKVYLVWETEDKKKAHSIYSSLKKGKVPEGGREVKDPSVLPKDLSKEIGRLSKEDRVTITKVRGTYYVLYLKDIEPRKIRPFSEVKEEIEEILKKSRMDELLEKKAWEIREKLEKGERVDVKPLEFENSSVEEFITLFKIRGDDTLRLVFSKDRVFGPYRTVNGYAVIYVETRKLSPELVKNRSDMEKDLIRAKEDALVNMYVEKLVEEAKIKINEEYLR